MGFWLFNFYVNNMGKEVEVVCVLDFFFVFFLLRLFGLVVELIIVVFKF